MRRRIVAIIGLLAGCGEEPTTTDVCEVSRSGDRGAVELGRGSLYEPVAEGETLEVQLGLQGLWMFIMNTRAYDMTIEDGETAAVWFNAVTASGETMSLDIGCRDREFMATSDGSLEMADPYMVALLPEYTSVLAGGMITLEVIVRDHTGHEAATSRTVIAQMPQMQ